MSVEYFVETLFQRSGHSFRQNGSLDEVLFDEVSYIPTYQWTWITGPGCSKLKTSLVNVSLKFQTLISQICQYFLLENVKIFCSAKASLIFSRKNFSVFGYEVVKHLMSWPLNKLVKLTMLWTSGPWWVLWLTTIKWNLEHLFNKCATFKSW